MKYFDVVVGAALVQFLPADFELYDFDATLGPEGEGDLEFLGELVAFLADGRAFEFVGLGDADEGLVEDVEFGESERDLVKNFAVDEVE